VLGFIEIAPLSKEGDIALRETVVSGQAFPSLHRVDSTSANKLSHITILFLHHCHLWPLLALSHAYVLLRTPTKSYYLRNTLVNSSHRSIHFHFMTTQLYISVLLHR